MSPIRVLIVDDDADFAESLSATLAVDKRVEVVASARDGAEAVAQCARELLPTILEAAQAQGAASTMGASV